MSGPRLIYLYYLYIITVGPRDRFIPDKYTRDRGELDFFLFPISVIRDSSAIILRLAWNHSNYLISLQMTSAVDGTTEGTPTEENTGRSATIPGQGTN